jgi:hypothetical protein
VVRKHVPQPGPSHQTNGQCAIQAPSRGQSFEAIGRSSPWSAPCRRLRAVRDRSPTGPLRTARQPCKRIAVGEQDSCVVFAPVASQVGQHPAAATAYERYRARPSPRPCRRLCMAACALAGTLRGGSEVSQRKSFQLRRRTGRRARGRARAPVQ